MTADHFYRVRFFFLSGDKQVSHYLVVLSAEEFGSIPAFHRKCSRMRAIELLIRILLVFMLNHCAASDQVFNKSDVSESTLAVTETTSCKQLIFVIKG